MGKFISLVSNGKGMVAYLNREQREEIKEGNRNLLPDSHTSICDYYCKNKDKMNKYEFNPLTKEFVVDQLNTKDDSLKVKRFCLSLDMKLITPELNIKKIIHPFKKRNVKVTKQDISNLKQWASVGDSVRASVWASVGDSVWDSVWDLVRDSVWASVGDSVRASVGDSVWDSVWDLVRDSVRDSVWASVGDSVWDSVWAYISSFFNIKQWKYIKHKDYENPFQCCIDLWEKGLVPSFDGKTWRLHTGLKAKIVFEISKKELLNK